MSETYWPLLGIYVFINFVILIVTINSLQKSYKNWKSDLERHNCTLRENPTFIRWVEWRDEAQIKTKYYRKLKKACFWLSPILLLALIPIYLVIFLVGAVSCAYKTYKD